MQWHKYRCDIRGVTNNPLSPEIFFMIKYKYITNNNRLKKKIAIKRTLYDQNERINIGFMRTQNSGGCIKNEITKYL